MAATATASSRTGMGDGGTRTTGTSGFLAGRVGACGAVGLSIAGGAWSRTAVTPDAFGEGATSGFGGILGPAWLNLAPGSLAVVGPDLNRGFVAAGSVPTGLIPETLAVVVTGASAVVTLGRSFDDPGLAGET